MAKYAQNIKNVKDVLQKNGLNDMPEVNDELNPVHLRQLQTRFQVDLMIFSLKFRCLECLEDALFSLSLNGCLSPLRIEVKAQQNNTSSPFWLELFNTVNDECKPKE